jgi:hypothetical protein
LKRKLIDTYGSHIFFADIDGRRNVVCFRDMANLIISDKWYSEREKSAEDDSVRIVRTAAMLIKSQIRDTPYNTEVYPNNDTITNRQHAKNWMPNLLQEFLHGITSNELKQIAIGHSIVQASRPRSVISPVLFSIGVSLDHVFGSKWLIELMSHLGFSLSYDEITRYKQSVLVSENSQTSLPNVAGFMQWAADNVDHYLGTLDGSGSFHGMGVINMLTPNSTETVDLKEGTFCDVPVKRMKRVKAGDLTRNRTIPIVAYKSGESSKLATCIL